MNSAELRRRIYWVSALLLIFVVAFVISVVFLNPSSVGNENFLWFFNLWASVWALLFLVVLLLTFALARNLIKLFFEHQSPGVKGRIQRKLILTFVIFSLFPALIMASLAFGLINQNLRRWVSAPSEQLLESANVITQEFYRLQRERIVSGLQRLRAELQRLPPAERTVPLVGLAADLGAVALVDNDGSRLTGSVEAASRWRESGAQPPPVAEPFYQLQPSVNLGEGRVVDRGVAAVSLGDGQVLAISFEVDRSVAFHRDRVRQAEDAYRGVVATLGPLRVNYMSILALTMLAVVFGFVWLGNYIARRLTVPLEALAEGSHELAEGNLDYRVEVETVDELKIVVEAFNRMAGQLRENRRRLEEANAELVSTNVRLDERREYIETVLQNIATGVLTIDAGRRIRTANEAAVKMFQMKVADIVGRSIDELVQGELGDELLQLQRRAGLYGTYRTQLTIPLADQELYVAATMTRNSAAAGRQAEYVLVLDDLTELIRAEKFAAWQEVAQRLAHEIKNPLTPIQLSAERLKKRFAAVEEAPVESRLQEFGKLLDDSTELIVAEAEMLKQLVAEFSRFARLPICTPEPVDLNDLVQRTLALYDGALGSVSVETQLDNGVGIIQADPQQLQRALINLIDNALAALADAPGERLLQIRTRIRPRRGTACIEVADTGEGISAENYEHLFLPYFSTRKKGTGLGLAIVQQIISEHGGFVRAEPNQPSGSRFVVELPVVSVARAAEA